MREERLLERIRTWEKEPQRRGREDTRRTTASTTRTQWYGTFLVLVKKTAGVGTHEAKAIVGESPGQSCNPNRAPFGNPKK